MGADLAGIEPHGLWEAFAGLTLIPRPSGAEERARQHVRGWASDSGFATRQDDAGNLIVDVPASDGAEGAPPVALQAHLDMVCERDPDVRIDFANDPIPAYVDGDWVRARGTTLGADNGIGVAAAMAAAADRGLARPPLELVFTVEEETGLRGALLLDSSLVRSRSLINMDSEEDGEVMIGCAGGARVVVTLEPSWQQPAAGLRTLRVSVGGLGGGHSGMQIAENRGNALRLLGRTLLAAARAGVDAELAAVAGGSADNAIPRDAVASVRVSADQEALLRGAADDAMARVRDDLRGVDDGLTIAVAEVAEGEPEQIMSAADRDRVVRLLVSLPSGVLAMSRALPGLVETSANLGVARTRAGALTLTVAPRSSSEDALDWTIEAIAAQAALAGANVEVGGRYPGWRPDSDTRLLELTRASYRDVYGADPAVRAIHAGLECGALARNLPDAEMVSFGPTILGAHSPGERVGIPSVARFWEVLARTLGQLARA